jgi:hypothetical protein
MARLRDRRWRDGRQSTSEHVDGVVPEAILSTGAVMAAIEK